MDVTFSPQLQSFDNAEFEAHAKDCQQRKQQLQQPQLIATPVGIVKTHAKSGQSNATAVAIVKEGEPIKEEPIKEEPVDIITVILGKYYYLVISRRNLLLSLLLILLFLSDDKEDETPSFPEATTTILMTTASNNIVDDTIQVKSEAAQSQQPAAETPIVVISENLVVEKAEVAATVVSSPSSPVAGNKNTGLEIDKSFSLPNDERKCQSV